MVNPHWPYLPNRKDKYDNHEEEEGIEGVWSTIPDDPLDYHFYYHILDGDKAGSPPKILALEGNKHIVNEHFDRSHKSCLHLIAKSNNKVSYEANAKFRQKEKFEGKDILYLNLCVQPPFF